MDSATQISYLNPATLKPSLNPILVVDGAGLEKVKRYLSEPKDYVLDYETNMVDTFYQRRARTIQLGDRDQQFIIDLLAFAETSERLWDAQGGYGKPDIQLWKGSGLERHLRPTTPHLLNPVWDVLRPSFDSDQFLKIGHNLEFEYIVSKWCLGLRLWHLYDTMHVERLLWNGLVPATQKDFFGLADVVLRYTGMRISKDAQTTFDLETPLVEDQIVYCALDVRLPLAVKAAQEKKVEKAGLKWVVQIEMDAIPAFGDMHLNGMYVNPIDWQKIIDKNQLELAEAIRKMDEHFIPVIGRKREPNFEEAARLKAVWEGLRDKSYDEEVLSNQIKHAKRGSEAIELLKKQRQDFELIRTEKRELAKQAYQDENRYCLKKYTDEFGKMEGEAEINYNSAQQVADALKAGAWGFNDENLPDTDDGTLEQYEHLPVIQSFRDYRSAKKALGTYGDRWILTKDQMCTLGNSRPGFVDPDTGRIHSRFLQLGTDTGRPSSTNPNCFSDDTEVLTKRGWILFSDLVDEDLVAQYDTISREISFVLPEKHHVYPYSGSLLRIYTEEQIDLFVTPNHRCLVLDRRSFVPRFKEASIYPKDDLQINAGCYKGKGQNLTSSQVGVICALQADGHVRVDCGALEFSFAKLRKIERLESFLQQCKLPYRKSVKSYPYGSGKRYCLCVSRKDIPVWLDGKKLFGSWLLEYSAETLALFAKEVFFWDGYAKEQNSYTSAIKQNADWVQIIHTLNEVRSAVRSYPSPKGKPHFWAMNAPKPWSNTANHVKEYVPYVGNVYCVTMPLGTCVVRRNGKVAITGNCLNLPREAAIRESFQSREGYDMVTKDCAGQELRLLAEYSQEPSWLFAFNNEKDVHSTSTAMLRKAEWDKGTLPDCAFVLKGAKCKCPIHKKLRDRYKAVTLGIIMGKQKWSLAKELKISPDEAGSLIEEWFVNFAKNKEAIDRNQEVAYKTGEARTLAGRRRIITQVDYNTAKRRAVEKYGDTCSQRQVTNMVASMVAALKREGGNVCYQGSAADLMKRAMGCGFDASGKPYLWHILEPQYNALLENYVYDEFVVESPEDFSEKVSFEVSDAIRRAGAEIVKSMPMTSEGGVAKCWQK